MQLLTRPDPPVVLSHTGGGFTTVQISSVPGLPLKMKIRGLPFLNLRGLPFLQREVMGKNVCMNEMNCFEQLPAGRELHGGGKEGRTAV